METVETGECHGRSIYQSVLSHESARASQTLSIVRQTDRDRDRQRQRQRQRETETETEREM